MGEPSGKRALYIVGGSKGGVGKTLFSLAFADYLRQVRKRDVFVVETDTSNPDVAKAMRDVVPFETLDLDTNDGWVDLIDLCDREKEKDVLVNTAARNNRGVAAYGKMLQESLSELGRELSTFWLVNRQRDSLELLVEYLENLPGGTVHVVRNNYFGASEKFALYNDSRIRGHVERNGGRTLDFPDLGDRVADALFSERLCIEKGMERFPIGNRAELSRWRNRVAEMFSPLFRADVE